MGVKPCAKIPVALKQLARNHKAHSTSNESSGHLDFCCCTLLKSIYKYVISDFIIYKIVLPEKKFSHLKGVNKQPLDIRTHASKDVYFPAFHLCRKKNSTMINSSSLFMQLNCLHSSMSWLRGAFDL